MVAKLAELAIVVGLLTLSQRLAGYENKPLGHLLLALAAVVLVHWFWVQYGEYASKRPSAQGNPAKAGRLRTIATVLTAAVLLGFVAYPWIAGSESKHSESKPLTPTPTSVPQSLVIAKSTPEPSVPVPTHPKPQPPIETLTASARQLADDIAAFLIMRNSPKPPPFENSPRVVEEFATRSRAYDIDTVEQFMKRFGGGLARMRQAMKDQDLRDNDVENLLHSLDNNSTHLLGLIAERVRFIADHLGSSDDRIALDPRERHLSKRQKQRIALELKGATGLVVLSSMPDCRECNGYASEFAAAFKAAKWTVISRLSLFPRDSYHSDNVGDTSGMRIYMRSTGLPGRIHTQFQNAIKESGINTGLMSLTGKQLEVGLSPRLTQTVKTQYAVRWKFLARQDDCTA